MESKVIIITGASSGIGKALALKLANYNTKLVLAARNKEKLKQLSDDIKKTGCESIFVKTDVSKKEDCKNLISETTKTFGKIDILINNAGITMFSYFDKIKDPDIFRKIIDVNYFGSVYCTYFALPYLKESKGLIVAISSLTGKSGVPTRTGYAASKHAMVGFFDSLRIELMDYNVDVMIVYPGFVKSAIRENALNEEGQSSKKSHINEEKAMSATKCAQIIIKGIQKRKREIIMTLKGKLGVWLKLISPSLVDRIAKKTIENS